MFAAAVKDAEYLVQEIPKNTVLPHLVAHRGFHNSSSSKNVEFRPTENGLWAYELAMKLGFGLVECDITMTNNGVLLLCHDEDFMRVSKNKREDIDGLKVRSQSSMFLQSNVVLQDGSTPPTLAEALTVCKAFGGKMVVDIKTEAFGMAERVLDFFILNPELLQHVESFISFGQDTICMLARAMKRAFWDAPRLPKFLLLVAFGEDLETGEKCFRVEDMHELHGIIKQGELEGIVLWHDIVGGHPSLKTVALSEEFKIFLEWYDVGICGLPTAGHDCLDYAKRLISEGFVYVNTDLPLDYLPQVKNE